MLMLSFSSSAQVESQFGYLPDTYSAAHFQFDSSGLARWRDYALFSITPHFSWATPLVEGVLPRVTDRVTPVSPASFKLTHNDDSLLSLFPVSVSSSAISDTPYARPLGISRMAAPAGSLHRYVVAPSLVHPWGEHGQFDFSAILAYQRFVSLDMGAVAWNEGLRPIVNDGSFGTGVRFNVGSALGERLNWNVGYQSRVNMDAFNNYYGVYSEPGDFDIPADAGFTVEYELMPSLHMQMGVDRIMYAAITPFTSAALPTRFLALLGDGISPVFAWQDLTVYSVGWNWRSAAIGNIQLRYTTRQQPLPTSAILEQALVANMSNNNISLGWSRDIGKSSHLSLQTSYSSTPYFLGLPTYRLRNDVSADQLEFEALWTSHF